MPAEPAPAKLPGRGEKELLGQPDLSLKTESKQDRRDALLLWLDTGCRQSQSPNKGPLKR